MNETINDYMNVSDIPGIDDGDADITLEKFELVPVVSDLNKRSDDIANDYGKVRQNMDFQQQMLLEAAKIALENARNGEHPKQMEVFATLMAQLTALNKGIISVHKDVTEISKPATPVGDKPTINAENVYIGSTSDLMDKYGSQQDAQDEKVVNPDD